MSKKTALVLFTLALVLSITTLAIAEYDSCLQAKVMNDPRYNREIIKTLKCTHDIQFFGPIKSGKSFWLFGSGHYIAYAAKQLGNTSQPTERSDKDPSQLRAVFVSEKECLALIKLQNEYRKANEGSDVGVVRVTYIKYYKKAMQIGNSWHGTSPKGGPWCVIVFSQYPFEGWNNNLFYLSYHKER